MRTPDELMILAQQIQKPHERFLKWKQVCERLERGKNTKFAQSFQKVSEIMKGATVKERELAAYADVDYRIYLESLDDAEKKKIKAQVEYENLRTNFEALQSALSYDKEAMKRNI